MMRIKLSAIFMGAFFFFAFSHVSFAQAEKSVESPAEEVEAVTYKGTSTKFAMVASNESQLNTALVTAKMMRVKENDYKFKVLITGTLAKDIIDNPDLSTEIDKSEELGIELVVCDHAIKREGSDKSRADERLGVEPNTVIYLFELQDEGYNILQH